MHRGGSFPEILVRAQLCQPAHNRPSMRGNKEPLLPVNGEITDLVADEECTDSGQQEVPSTEPMVALLIKLPIPTVVMLRSAHLVGVKLGNSITP